MSAGSDGDDASERMDTELITAAYKKLYRRKRNENDRDNTLTRTKTKQETAPEKEHSKNSQVTTYRYRCP